MKTPQLLVDCACHPCAVVHANPAKTSMIGGMIATRNSSHSSSEKRSKAQFSAKNSLPPNSSEVSFWIAILGF